jgi:hypothetical protein
MAKVLNADPGIVGHWESNLTTPAEPRLSELTALLQQKIDIAKLEQAREFIAPFLLTFFS